MSPGRIVVGVCLAWVVIGLIVGAQATLGGALMNTANAPTLAAALRNGMIQTLPWIPVTLAAIALAVRFPLGGGRGNWLRHLPIHLGAALLLAFVANALVVLGYWITTGQFKGLGALARAGLMWATIRLHIGLLIYTGILGITHAVLTLRRARERELHFARVEGQLARAQLQALNAQIRPHFLFNTLHTIGQLWRSNRSDDADAVLDHLGALFHKVQSSTSRVEIPLGEELTMVREYLAIESARFPDRLRARVTAADDILACPVPPLILQPIVENAVRHGISATSSAGQLEITAERVNGSLRLIVRDDGPGPRATSARSGGGVGLRNTRERLAQLYGERGRLSIQEGERSGTVVVIEVPVDNHSGA